MTDPDGLLHETTYRIAADSVGTFDDWVEGRLAEIRELAGPIDSCLLAGHRAPDGPAVRIVRHRFESADALDEFLAGKGAEIDAELDDRFGEDVTSDSRLYREAETGVPAAARPLCQNCGARLGGQYCGECGQRYRSRLISLWELVRDAFGDLFDVDSRLWQTLFTLLIHPGRLTHEYLQGRRAKYMPPFRSYLVLSLVFFVVAFFDPREEFGLLFEPAAEPGQAEAQQAEAARKRREAVEELAAQGILVDAEPRAVVAGRDVARNGEPPGDDGTRIDCDIESFNVEGLPDWIARRLTPERLRHICMRARLDNGRALIDNLLETIPAALIVLLPVIAVVLKLLYPLSRRYYVEHLLFFVHFHAFFFLILTLDILFTRLAARLALPESITTVVITGAVIYVPAYLFIGMRRVYGQGRLVTAFKFFVLVTAYLVGLLLTMLAALTKAAFSL